MGKLHLVLGKSTPTFIHELKLCTSPWELGVLNIRLDVARQIYNLILGEALKRLKIMRDSTLYRRALKEPKKIKNSKNKLILNLSRAVLFKKAKETYSFSEYDMHAYLTKAYSNTWLTSHIDSLTAQRLASRAFDAVEKYAYKLKGRPRFKGKNCISSIEGKNNKSGIRFINGNIVWSVRKGHKLVLNPKYDSKDKYGLEEYALSCKTKYVRLVRKTIKGSFAWYAQLVQEGKPHIKKKNKIKSATIGLDIGPSTIAIVGENYSNLQPFCSDVEDYRKDISTTQRQISRSLRYTNPNNFEDDTFKVNANGRLVKKKGKLRKGPKTWLRSKRYQRLHVKISEQQRKMAAARKSSHGRLVNDLLKIGNEIKTEKLSYKSFQKNFGRSVAFRAPGLFLEKLRRKAESAGGKVIEFDTRSTALSQVCHCGNRVKKSLKERWHRCTECGVIAQRDLYSAFLSQYVRENRLDTNQASQAWSGADILLEQAVSNLNKTANSKNIFASFGLGQRQSGLSAKEGTMQNKTLDVVAWIKDPSESQREFCI